LDLETFKPPSPSIEKKHRVDVLFLGGGSDELKAERDSKGYKSAGNHDNADIRGDWGHDAFWTQVQGMNPRLVVMNSGSTSWR